MHRNPTLPSGQYLKNGSLAVCIFDRALQRRTLDAKIVNVKDAAEPFDHYRRLDLRLVECDLAAFVVAGIGAEIDDSRAVELPSDRMTVDDVSRDQLHRTKRAVLVDEAMHVVVEHQLAGIDQHDPIADVL